MYNNCLHVEYFSTPWKIANVVVIQKPGKNNLIPTNHWTVSLLNTIAKTFEVLLLTCLKKPAVFLIRPEHYYNYYNSTNGPHWWINQINQQERTHGGSLPRFQGSRLSPLLFNLYIMTYNPPPRIKINFFANDTMYSCSSMSKANTMLQTYFKMNFS